MTDAPPASPDYLARDYDGFRALMLDHLAALAPGSAVAGVASLEATLVETLAYLADDLSYYQDAVATEAYLATARRRVSIARHARLLDYRLRYDCSARSWVRLETASDGVEVPRGTALVTRIAGIDAVALPTDFDPALGEVFETLHGVRLMRAHNRMLPAAAPLPGARHADLAGQLPSLGCGDVLLFEHFPSQTAWPVRLVAAAAGDGLTRIGWHEEDALPLALPAGGYWHVLGNIVLADHGRSRTQPFPRVPPGGLSEIEVACAGLCFAAPYSHSGAVLRSAADAMRQDCREAEPSIALVETAPFLKDGGDGGRERWTGRRELLGATQFDRSFAVEPGEGGRVTLRFGDGVRGRRIQPEWGYVVRYRSGGGSRGNVGPDTLAHILIDDDRILSVRNPLAASGGANAEANEEARLRAPFMSRIQRRCVTADDYQARTNRFQGVAASLVLRETISGRAVVAIRVLREGGLPCDEAFLKRLCAWLDPFRLIGDEVRLAGARYVEPEIELALETEPGWSVPETVAAVRERLAAIVFGFGEAVDPDRLAARANAVPGVARARICDVAGLPATPVGSFPPVVRLVPDRIAVSIGP